MTTQTAQAQGEGINKAWFYFLLCLAVFGTMTGVMMVPALLVEIATDLDVSVAVAGQLTTATFAAWALSIVAVGPLADSLGRRPMALAGVFLVVVSLVASAFAPNIETLMALRVLAGLGGGAIAPTSIGVISDVISPAKRAQAIGGIASTIVLTSAISIPLADAKFWVDILQFGCWGHEAGEAILCSGVNWEAAWLHFIAVAHLNSKNWPVTTHDLAHARAHRDSVSRSPSNHKFVDCSGPVPRIEDLSVRQDSSGDFRAAWTYQGGCVSDVTIDTIRMDFKVYFEGAWEPTTVRERVYSTDTTSLQFDVDSYEYHTPVAVTVKVYLVPDDKEYGGSSYQQDIALSLDSRLH